MNRVNRPNRKEARNREILTRAQAGETHAKIAINYGITPSRVQQIVQKESKWAQLQA